MQCGATSAVGRFGYEIYGGGEPRSQRWHVGLGLIENVQSPEISNYPSKAVSLFPVVPVFPVPVPQLTLSLHPSHVRHDKTRCPPAHLHPHSTFKN